MLRLAFDGDAHTAGGASYNLDCGVEIVGVELLHLGFGDFFELLAGNLANFFAVRFAAALLDADLFTNRVIDWLAQTLPGKGAVFVYLDVNDYVLAHKIFGRVIERVDEVHHV